MHVSLKHVLLIYLPISELLKAAVSTHLKSWEADPFGLTVTRPRPQAAFTLLYEQSSQSF